MYSNVDYDLPMLTDKFLKYLKRNNYSSETIIGYQKDLESFSRFIYEEYNGKVLFEQLTRNDILDYNVYLQNVKRYKVNSVQRHLSSLKSFNRFLVDELNLKENIAAKVKHKQVFTPLPPVLSVEEVSLLLEEAKKYSHYFYTLIALLYYTGSRITAAVSLEKKNVNLKDRELYFPLVKGGKDLYLPIHDRLYDILADFLENHPAKSYLYVFPSRTNPGTFLSPQTARLHLKKITANAGIEKHVTPHILRHSIATHLTKAGVDQTFISRFLDHEDSRPTKRYQRVNVKDLGDKINIIS